MVQLKSNLFSVFMIFLWVNMHLIVAVHDCGAEFDGWFTEFVACHT